MKRFLSLLLVAAMLLSLTPAFAAGKTPFEDVPAGVWYEDAAAYLNEQGYVNGVSKTRFDPDGSMTRAMVVTILSRMGGGVLAAEPSGFADVPADAWFAAAVDWAAANDITNGVDDTRFDPDGVVTREMLSTLLWRYAALRYDDEYIGRYKARLAFTDADPVSDWAQEAMRLSVGSGVIKGRLTDEGTRWDAQQTCTRAEAVTMLYRFLKLEFTDKEPAAAPELDADQIADVSLRLFRAMENPGKNIVASPLSIIYALAMLNNGASGETKAQMEALFGCDSDALTSVLAAYADTLPNRYGKGVVRLADAMWVRKGEPIAPEFIRLNRDQLGAEVFERDFGPAALAELNDWVSKQTDGMIPSILSELPPEAILVLLNALLFKCNWLEGYTVSEEKPFHAANGETKSVDMLKSTETVYLHDDSAVGFLKPFEGHYAFAVIVPNEGVTPAEYLRGLNGASLRSLLRGEKYDAVYTYMPKFKQSFESDLMAVFPKVGLTNLKHLGGISPGAFVSDAIHKAVIDVNEDGVSAAAVTAIVVGKTAVPTQPQRVATVVADRPYLYMIVDTNTNLPLFIGINESI